MQDKTITIKQLVTLKNMTPEQRITALYEAATRRQTVGNRADPTLCTTWTWSVPLPFDNTLHIKISVIWDVELLYAINHRPFKRIAYGHETKLGLLTEQVWSMLEDREFLKNSEGDQEEYDLYYGGP